MALKDSVLNVVIRAKDATGNGFRKLRGSLSGAEKQTNKLANSIRNAVVAIGALAATYLSLRAITGFFTGAVRESAEFEEQLAKVQAVSQASTEEMKRLKQAATEMGRDTTFNASQAANAMETLSRAGLNTEETLQALPEVLALARGNSIELAEAASLVTQSIQGMGGTFEESGRYADVLTRAAQRANTNVVGLGQALSYAAPTARALGLDVEQTAALVGKLADAGIDASRAGTALNSIFSQFQNPASKFRGELDALGISTNDFSEALAQLERSGKEGQAAINAVGQEAGPALRALLAGGVDSIKELEDELRNAGGAAKQAADTMDDTLPGALERLSSAWRTLKRAIGDNVLGPAKNAVDELAAGIADFVEGGGAEKLGQQFRAMFIEITDRAREFIKSFDFKGAMSKAGDALESFGEIASKTGAALRITGNVISTVWNGVAFVVAGALATVAKSVAGFALLANEAVQGLNAIGAVSDETAAKIDMHANALNASADALMNYSVGALNQVGQNLGVVSEETSKATEEAEKNAAATKKQTAATDAGNTSLQRRHSLMGEVWARTEQTTRATADQAQKVEDLQAKYDALKASGTASVQELGEVLVELNREQDKAVESSDALESAFRTLGVTSQAELIEAAETAKTAFEEIQASGTASAEDVERAYVAYAKAVKETGDETLISAVEAEGAALGLTNQLEEAGKAGAKAGDDIKGGLDKAKQASDELEQEQKEAAAAAEARTSKLEAFGNAFGKAMSNARTQVSALSKAARALFEQRLLGDDYQAPLDNASARLEAARRQVDELASAQRRMMNNSFSDWFADVALKSARVKQEYYEQAVALDALQQKMDDGQLSIRQLNQAAAQAGDRFNLLDEQTLSGLQSAISAATARMEGLNDSADRTVANMKRRLAELRGDTEEVARINYEAERESLQNELENARQQGADSAAADYEEALGQLQQIRDLERQKAQEAEAERQRQREEREAQRQARERARQEADRARTTTTNRQQSQRSAGQTVILQAPNGDNVEVQTNDPDGFLSVLEQAGLRSSQ